MNNVENMLNCIERILLRDAAAVQTVNAKIILVNLLNIHTKMADMHCHE